MPVVDGDGVDNRDQAILRELDSEIVYFKGLPPLTFFVDIEKTVYSNPLLWWKSMVHKLPLLGRRAQKVLAIMATSAPSERVFSAAGNVVTKNRARMSADIVADLILLKQSLLPAKAYELKKSQNAPKRARLE